MLFELDRYHQGQLMAEGAKVEAESLDEAIAKAKALFHEPEFKDDEFKVRDVF